MQWKTKGRFRRTEASPIFSEADFKTPTETCDLVMKGGVTSGVVYPYAILEIACRYRLCSVGGTSAGGIAAAFAAAAEYGRARGQPHAFVRLEQRCLELPGRLRSLFQAEPHLRPLMDIALAASRGGMGRVALAVLSALWISIGAGGLAAALFARVLGGGDAATVLSAILGVIVAAALRLGWLLFVDLRRNDYGLCRGLGRNAKTPALTEWLHASLQFIAFGDKADQHRPLTFGDLEDQGVALRMMTTNLSMRRPHALPAMVKGVMFSEARWRRLFPEAVMKHLMKVGTAVGWEDYRHCPSARNMPVIMAVRMSLSFPFLISAVPMLIRDLGGEQREVERRTQAEERHARAIGIEPEQIVAPARQVADLWFSDGGLTSNFPLHFFDAPLPARPTFALSLDDLPKGEPAPSERVRMQMKASEGIYLPITRIASVGGFAMSILGAAKDWQDTLLSGMPGQRERIVRVALSDDEGGLNLDMPPDRSKALMAYGREAGLKLKAEFSFDEHKWRRGLVVYEQLERTVEATAAVWTGGYGNWLSTYPQQSYKKNKGASRSLMQIRLQAFASLSGSFIPPLRDKGGHFPKPVGRLKITPDV